ncbi:hypothetical protein EDB80DRAFT_702890 [Ilyonectria destructans]|nr:hypothetical protein EDB80DRAFT_702890 [Ilyonectria destructans]
MFESRQPSAAETVSSFSQSQASASSSATRVEIILTPPTPIDGHVTAKHYGEDTNKEVIQLDNIIEEKEVYDKKDISDEKQVYTEDSKEVVCITQAENVKPQHADGAEKEVYHPQIAYDGVEKEVAPSHYWSAQSKHDMTEKEVYGSDKTDAQHDDPNQRRDHQQESAISEQSMETQDNEETSRVQARINNMSKAVDKRAKALSTFTTQSNTRLREGYARIGQTITDRSVAVEQGATGRLKRLEQGFSKRINRIEEGTTKRLNRLEDGFNDRVNRAGKSVDSQVASLKQNINGVKKIGSKTQKDKCNSEETKVE